MTPGPDPITKEELTTEFHRVANKIGKTPAQSDIREHGKYSNTPYQNQFGSWNKALKEMGYEINVDRNITKEKLLNELNRLAEDLNKTPGYSEMDKHGKFSSSTYERRFETWTHAVKEAGLTPAYKTPHNRRKSIKYIRDIQRVALDIGESPTRKQYEQHGNYGTAPISRRFDGWSNALVQAGLEINKRWKEERITINCDNCGTSKKVLESSIKNNDHTFCSRTCQWQYFIENNIVPADPPPPGTGKENRRWVTKKEVIEDYQQVAEKLDKTPSQQEYNQHGRYSQGALRTKFEGMKDLQKQAELEPLRNELVWLTCEICGIEFDVSHSTKDNRRCCSRECSNKWRQKAYAGENNYNWKGGRFPYGKGWNYRKKEAVRERDNRKCRECGRTEQEHIEIYGTKHHVHHIMKARKVDDPEIRNSMDNLITLCHGKCHKKWEGIPLKPQ